MDTIDRLVRILDEERTKRIDHSEFAARQIASLHQAIDELKAENENLEGRVRSQEEANRVLRAHINTHINKEEKPDG